MLVLSATWENCVLRNSAMKQTLRWDIHTLVFCVGLLHFSRMLMMVLLHCS